LNSSNDEFLSTPSYERGKILPRAGLEEKCRCGKNCRFFKKRQGLALFSRCTS